MKNFLILTLTFFFAFNIYAQNDTTNTILQKEITIENISEAERIIDKYSEKVANGFNDMVENITPAAKEGFNFVVIKNFASGLAALCPIPISLIFLMLFLGEYKRISNILNGDNVPSRYTPRRGPLYEDNVSISAIIYLVLFIVLFVIGSSTFYYGIMHVIAPEWYAIKDIINLIK